MQEIAQDSEQTYRCNYCGRDLPRSDIYSKGVPSGHIEPDGRPQHYGVTCNECHEWERIPWKSLSDVEFTWNGMRCRIQTETAHRLLRVMVEQLDGAVLRERAEAER